jgi:hypothetical protein
VPANAHSRLQQPPAHELSIFNSCLQQSPTCAHCHLQESPAHARSSAVVVCHLESSPARTHKRDLQTDSQLQTSSLESTIARGHINRNRHPHITITREICNWTKEQENKDSGASAINRGQRVRLKTSSDLNFLARTRLWHGATIARILNSDLSAACKQISSNSSSFSSTRKRTLQACEQRKADE